MQTITARPSRLPAALAAAIFAAVVPSAFSQTAPTTPPSAAANPKETVVLDKFEVASFKVDGLNNKTLFRTDEEAPLPFNVIDRFEIDRLGATSMEELFRNIPEATNYGNVLQSAVGNPNVSGGQTYSTAAVNLRGFGTTQTVVLINGRRLGAGSNVGGPDISRIPIGMIERIEILPEAASAIYGGDAIGGAVNIILRKDYNSRDITTYIGTSTQGGGTEYRATYLDGRTLNNGKTKLTVTLDFNQREPVYMRQRDYLQRALAKYTPDTPLRSATGVSAFETVTLRAFAGVPGNIVATNTTGGLNIPGNPTARYAAIPAGLNFAQASALTPASFTATAGRPDLEPRYNRSVLYRPQENYSLQTQLEHDFIKDKLSFYLESNVAYQRQNYRFPQFLTVSLTATDPNNPLRTGVTPGFVGVPATLVFDTPDIRDPSSFQARDDARLTFGFKGTTWRDWQWTFDVSGQYQRLFSDAHNPQNNLGTYLTRRGPNDPGTGVAAPTSLASRWAAYNPFVDHGLYPISNATETNLFIYDRHNSYYNRNAQVAFRLVGELYQLPAGPLRVSPGGDLRWDDQRTAQYIPIAQGMADATALTTFQPSFTPTSETIRAAFVETTIPVVGRNWRPLRLHSAEIGASRRWNVVNHTRNTRNGTLSGSISPIPGLTLRGSYTEGTTRTPAANLSRPVTTSPFTAAITDPQRGNISVQSSIPTYVSGGNPLLRTEAGRSKSFGVILRPAWVRGLSLTVNYFETKRRDTSAVPAANDILNFPQDYPGRLERAPLTAADQAAGYTAGAITRLNVSRINLASVWQNGFDIRSSYQLPVPAETFGRVNWSATFTNYNHYKTKVRPSTGAVEFADTLNNPLRWRGNSSVSWSRGNMFGSVTMKYTNSYYTSTTKVVPAFPTATGWDGHKIPHSTTYDLQLGYKIPAGSFGASRWKRWLDTSEFRLGISNVLDTDPPFSSDSTGFYSRYDDPRQRYVYLQIKKNL
jgi:outer membrane receptor protein involved in Fe transport